MTLIDAVGQMKIEADRGKLSNMKTDNGLRISFWCTDDEQIGRIKFLTLFRREAPPSQEEIKMLLPQFFDMDCPVFQKMNREKRFKHFIQLNSGNPFGLIEEKLIKEK